MRIENQYYSQVKLPDSLMNTILESNPPRTYMISLYQKLLANGGVGCVCLYETPSEVMRLMDRGVFQADQIGRASLNIERAHNTLTVNKPDGHVVDECSCGNKCPCEDLREARRISKLPVKLIKGAPNGCHKNSAKLWSEGKGKIVTGYALSDDGLWRQHSWVNAGNQLIETTEPRVIYFGYTLDEDESKEFDNNNY